MRPYPFWIVAAAHMTTIPQNAPRDYSPLMKRDAVSPRLETPTRKRNRRAWVQIAMFLHADKVKSQKGAA